MTGRAEQIQARLDARTPGHWAGVGVSDGRSDVEAYSPDYYGGRKSVATAADSEFGACSDGDADLIAQAPSDLAWLLAERVKLQSAAQSEAAQAWRSGYYTGKRDYAGSITGGMPISTPNPYLGEKPEGDDR